MWATNKHRGFTIVELLIVIVIIAILAAISIVAYNGVQQRAKQSALASDMASNNKSVKLGQASVGSIPRPSEITLAGAKLSAAQRIYTLSTYCSSTTNYALVSETTTGDVYYSLNGGSLTQNNALDSINPCPTLGVASATNYYIGLPATACAAETGSCTFSGTASVAFGSAAQGTFIAKKNQTSPVTCSNANFTDPSPGYPKSCYVLSY